MREIGDGKGDEQLALHKLLADVKKQVKTDGVTVCNLGNDLVEKIIRGMMAAVSACAADEFDLADVKPGRNVFGKCRFQHVCTDGACGEYLIQVDGHVKVRTLSDDPSGSIGENMLWFLHFYHYLRYHFPLTALCS